jgi:hypothetical protein
VVVLASLEHWLTQHPAYADWGVAVGTILLAGATFFLALQARSEAKKVADQARTSATQVAISRAALEAEVRPVLIDISPPTQITTVGGFWGQEVVPYEENTESRTVNRDAVHVDAIEAGHFICSLSLRNAGRGIAIVMDEPRLTHQQHEGDLIGRLTTQLVPPGEATRAYFGPGIALHTPVGATLIATVRYADASGSNAYWTKAIIQQRGGRWRVVQVVLGEEGREEPLVTSAAAI